MGPPPGTSNWAIVEHEDQAVRPCPLPSSRGLYQTHSYEQGRLSVRRGSVKLGDGGRRHCSTQALKSSGCLDDRNFLKCIERHPRSQKPRNLPFMCLLENVKEGIWDRKEQQESPISDKAPANLLSFGLWEQQ